MGHKTVADYRTLARKNLEDSLWHAGFTGQFSQTNGREWCPLSRLHDDRITSGKRRREPPGGNGHGKVPRGDDSDDAEGFMERNVDAASDRDLLAHQALWGTGVVLEDVAHMVGFPASLRDGVSRVSNLKSRQVLNISSHSISKASKNLRPLRGREASPASLGRLGVSNCIVGLFERGGLDGFHGLGSCRVDQLIAHQFFFR